MGFPRIYEFFATISYAVDYVPFSGERRMTPNKHRKSAVIRRARQNKTPKQTQAVQTWGVRSEAQPAMISAAVDNQIYHIIQSFDSGTFLTSSAGADVFSATSFLLSFLPQYASLIAVFDQYRIAMIECWITPTYQDTSGGNSNSRYLTVIDYDDDNTPSTTGQLLSYSNCTDTSSYTGVYRKFVPHCASSGPSTNLNVTAPWIDSASSSAKHFGLKVGLFTSNVTTTLQLKTRYHVEFRNVF